MTQTLQKTVPNGEDQNADHAVLAAHDEIDRQFVCDLWVSLAGRRARGAGADARIYDPSLGGLACVLKFINQTHGDWSFRNLDLFISSGIQKRMNHQQCRRLSRHLRRLEGK